MKSCECGDIREGAIFRGNIMAGWYLECPVCHLPQDGVAKANKLADDFWADGPYSHLNPNQVERIAQALLEAHASGYAEALEDAAKIIENDETQRFGWVVDHKEIAKFLRALLPDGKKELGR